MSCFDWHKDPIGRDTPVDAEYKNTQNVRRFLSSECSTDFKFTRPFMAWIKDGRSKTMGEVADEWMRQIGRFS